MKRKTDTELEVIVQAIAWWASHRPVDSTEEWHVRNPCVCLVRDEDYRLAIACAAHVHTHGGTKSAYERSVEAARKGRK